MDNIFNDDSIIPMAHRTNIVRNLRVDVGIVARYTIPMSDLKIRNGKLVLTKDANGEVSDIGLKRRGTYHGKRYDRQWQKTEY